MMGYSSMTTHGMADPAHAHMAREALLRSTWNREACIRHSPTNASRKDIRAKPEQPLVHLENFLHNTTEVVSSKASQSHGMSSSTDARPFVRSGSLNMMHRCLSGMCTLPDIE